MQRAIRCERLMRGEASEFLTGNSRTRPRSRSTHTLYIRLWKKCHPKYLGPIKRG